MSWTEKQIDKWKDFTDFVESKQVHGSYLPYWFFRGQSNFDWDLDSSLMRIIRKHKLGKNEAENFERTLFREFTSKSHSYKEIKTRNFKLGDNIVLVDNNAALWLSNQVN